jgi:hypothetical protein
MIGAYEAGQFERRGGSLKDAGIACIEGVIASRRRWAAASAPVGGPSAAFPRPLLEAVRAGQ